MQAATNGKLLVTLLMPALRCMSKATLPADFSNASPSNLAAMRWSATAHIIVAAAILVGCLLVSLYVIPKQIAKVQAIESLHVPPGEATIELLWVPGCRLLSVE